MPDPFRLPTPAPSVEDQIAAQQPATVRVEEILPGRVCTGKFKRHRWGSDDVCSRCGMAWDTLMALQKAARKTKSNDPPPPTSSAEAVGAVPIAPEKAGVVPVDPSGAAHLHAESSASLDAEGASPSEGPDGSAPYLSLPPAPPPAASPAGVVEAPPSSSAAPATSYDEPVPALAWVEIGAPVERMRVEAIMRRFLEDVSKAASTALRLLEA